MSIGPVNIHLMLQNTTDVHKFGVESAKPELHQQAVAEQAQKEMKHESHSVVKSGKSEHESIHEREQGTGGGYHGNKQKSKKQPQKSDEQKSKNSNAFDVSI